MFFLEKQVYRDWIEISFQRARLSDVLTSRAGKHPVQGPRTPIPDSSGPEAMGWVGKRSSKVHIKKKTPTPPLSPAGSKNLGKLVLFPAVPHPPALLGEGS